MLPKRPQHTTRQPPAKPIKVRGGVKLRVPAGGEAPGLFPHSWLAQRWMRLIEQAAPGDSLKEGLEYATLGQTRRLAVEPGAAYADVQGRTRTPYRTIIKIPTFTHDQWEKVIGALTDQAVHAARLLSGDLPTSVEDLFGPLGLHLFPVAPTDIVPTCDCRERTRPWCKHACGVAYLIADRFASDSFLIFTLRGIPRDELLDRLRQKRVLAGSATGSVPVYAAHVPGVSEAQAPPLEQCLERFWDIGPDVNSLDLPIARPEVSHPLLRRLGPSPFPEGQFPLVGLLATCYDVISDAAIRQEQGAIDEAPAEPPGDPGELVDDEE